MELILARLIGRRYSRWVKAIVLGFLALFIFFSQTRITLFNLLNWGLFGVSGIIAWVISIILVMCAWDSWHSG